MSLASFARNSSTAHAAARRHTEPGRPSSSLSGASSTEVPPPYTWSYSRAKLLDHCERLYYEHYYGSKGGWRPDAPARARLAYRLRQLVTPGAELGRAVHRRAAEIARAVRDGAPLPSHAALLDRTRAELSPVFTRRESDSAWRLDPRRAPVLYEAYYGRLSAARREELLADTCARASGLLAALLNNAIWDAARQPGAKILMIEDPILQSLDGVATAATPDLVLALPDGRVLVVDWKCGVTGDLGQVVFYAGAVHDALGPLASAGRIEAWLVHLDRGSIEAVTVTAEDRARTLAAMRASVARMTALHRPSVWGGAPLPEDFALASDPNRACRRCRHLEACLPELKEWAAPAA